MGIFTQAKHGKSPEDSQMEKEPCQWDMRSNEPEQVT